MAEPSVQIAVASSDAVSARPGIEDAQRHCMGQEASQPDNPCFRWLKTPYSLPMRRSFPPPTLSKWTIG